MTIRSLCLRLGVLLLVVILSGRERFALAGMTDPRLQWKTIDTKHFSINYHDGEEEIARKLAPIAENVYETLSTTFDARPAGRTEIVLVDNHDNSNGFTNVIPYNQILLRIAPPASDSILADYDQWLRELFLHEYTHVIHITDTRYPAKLLKGFLGKLVAPNGLTPGWVTEGIATYFETAKSTHGGRGESSFTEMMIRTDILQQQFLKLDQMAGTQYNWPSWMAQYLYGVSFWKYLADKYGEDKIVEFSHKYGASLWFFALNNKAKRVFKDEKGKGKSFYTLWKEWKADLEKRYGEVRSQIEKEGVQEGDAFLSPKKGESFVLPALSPDGKALAYLATSVHHPQELRLRDLETGKERVLLRKRDAQSLGFSRDGKKILLSNISGYKKYYHFSDLHEIDVETGKMSRLTRGQRAQDPDESPDGKRIVAVIQKTGMAALSVYDRESKKWTEVFEAEQIDQPQWLDDGKTIVASVHQEGQWDLWTIKASGEGEKRLTNDPAIETRTVVSSQGKDLYFSSDRNGIPNIYRYDLKTGKTFRVTNVVTGAMAPAVAPDGTVFFQRYNGRGYGISRVERGGERLVGVPWAAVHRGIPVQRSQDSGEPAVGTGTVSEPHNYHPFKKLFVPRYIMPNVALIDGAVFASAMITGNDPLYRHLWFIDGTYRSDNNFLGYDAGYTYNRYRMPISAGFSDFTVNYGDVFGFGTDFFEERRRGYIGTSLPISNHRLSLNYFFENRSEESGLPAGAILSTLGNYAGIHFQYSYRNLESTPASISPVEKGYRFNLNYEMTDHFLGSSEALEQKVIWGDARAFIRMPYANHHVLALRAAGGAAFGDQLLQGNFGLGGSIGEGPFTGTSTRVFTLRGMPLSTFSRDRVWVASAEYRMPLFRSERGLGTLPFAMNSAHLAVFADVGDAFNRGNPSFRPMLGVGGELRADFIVGYHLPIMGRLGYGILVTHRERIAGVPDSLTGWDARNGTVILEVGTSF